MILYHLNHVICFSVMLLELNDMLLLLSYVICYCGRWIFPNVIFLCDMLLWQMDISKKKRDDKELEAAMIAFAMDVASSSMTVPYA